MNEFTIDELILIGCWSINRIMHVGMDQAKQEGTVDLGKKIQDMIINCGDNKDNE